MSSCKVLLCKEGLRESRDVLSLHIQSGPRNLTFEKKEEKMNFHLPPYKRYLFAKLLTFFVLYPSTLLNYHSYIYYENTYQYNQEIVILIMAKSRHSSTFEFSHFWGESPISQSKFLFCHHRYQMIHSHITVLSTMNTLREND